MSKNAFLRFLADFSRLAQSRFCRALNSKSLSLVLIGSLYVAVRAYHLSFFALWHDEVFSVMIAQRSWDSMMHAVIADLVHPPLFYIILKIWIGIGGTSAWWLRVLPFAISLFVPIPLLLICSDLKLSEFQTTAVFLLAAVNPLLIAYAQEVRMYSLLVLLSLVSLRLFVLFITRGEKLEKLYPLLVTNVFLCYTHYYGILFVVTELLALVVWTLVEHPEHAWKRPFWLLAGDLAVASVFLPWAVVIAQAAIEKHGFRENLHDISIPSFASVIWLFGELSGNVPIRHAIFVAVVLFGIPTTVVMSRKSPQRTWAWVLSSFLVFPISIVTVASNAMHIGFFELRFFTMIAIPYLIVVALGCGSIPKALAAIVLTWATCSGAFYTHQTDRKIPWDWLARKTGSQHAAVYTCEPYERRPLEFYGAHNTLLRSPDEVTRIKDKEVYVIYKTTDWPQAADQVFRAQGYALIERVQVSAAGVTIIMSHMRKGANPLPETSPHHITAAR